MEKEKKIEKAKQVFRKMLVDEKQRKYERTICQMYSIR